MRATHTEAVYYPCQDLLVDKITSVLCIAPHPDDEILGCGGFLAKLAGTPCRIHVLILSRGECAQGIASLDLAVTRAQESLHAAQVLGLPSPVFLDWADRGIYYAEPLIELLQVTLAQIKPQYLLLPALSEPHPDHQSVALAGIAAAQRSQFPQTLLFYEVGAPLHPNTIFDITSVASLKWQALDEFTSQEVIQPYKTHAQALAVLRSFGRGLQCTAAEAFFKVEAASLRDVGAAAALPFWPAIRVRQGIANSPQQLPLVSILVRSMDRPHLSEAIASIAAQTYPCIELVVVNATGRLHSPVQYPQHRLTFQLVQPAALEAQPVQALAEFSISNADGAMQCGRAHAANLGLHAAGGEFALFLDDDDLIEPGHIERLVNALTQRSQAVAAYAGVRVDGEGKKGERIYDVPWSHHRIGGINFLPIHAVLFRMHQIRLTSQKFDESLPVLEDWDFWRRLADAGDFAHCPGVSAVYRQNHGSSGIGNPEHANHWLRWHLVLTERYLQGRSLMDNAKAMAWHAIELDKQGARIETLLADQSEYQEQINFFKAEHAVLHSQINTLKSENLDLQARETISASTHSLLQASNQNLKEELDKLQNFNQIVALERDSFKNSNENLNILHKEKNQQYMEARSEYALLLGEKALLQAELSLVERSRSWKITRPLRVVTSWISRIIL